MNESCPSAKRVDAARFPSGRRNSRGAPSRSTSPDANSRSRSAFRSPRDTITCSRFDSEAHGSPRRLLLVVDLARRRRVSFSVRRGDLCSPLLIPRPPKCSCRTFPRCGTVAATRNRSHFSIDAHSPLPTARPFQDDPHRFSTNRLNCFALGARARSHLYRSIHLSTVIRARCAANALIVRLALRYLTLV